VPGSYMWFWEDWLFYHDVIFDGENKLIYVNPNASYVDIKEDVYSSWKEWALVRDNLKFLSAIRGIGGDSIGGGLYAGDIYFLVNGWRLVLGHTVSFYGALFSDDYDSPFTTEEGTSLAQSTVSNLVLRTGAVTGSAAGLTPEQAVQLDQLISLNTQQTASDDTHTTQLTEILTSSSLQSDTLYEIQQSNIEMSGSLSVIGDNVDAILSAGGSLTPTQATMLMEIYDLLGLDPTKPLIVTPNARTVSTEISQSILQTGDTVTVTRS